MSFDWILPTVVVLVLFVCSMRRRISNYTRLYPKEKDFPVEPRESVLSNAIRDWVAVAGGVYLVLMALGAFLSLDIPREVQWGTFKFDPLAAFSFLLAVLQPYLPIGARPKE